MLFERWSQTRSAMIEEDMALSDNTVVRAKKDVVSRILDGEAVILELGSGTYYGLNDTGSEAWSLIAEGASLAQLRRHICTTFDVDEATAARDLEELLTELAARDLVDLT